MQNLSEVRVDKDLLLKFFLVFARFEYALKHAGFAQGDQNQIRPDWTEFANRIHQSFNRSTSNELAEAVEYILRINPPMKEVLINGKVAWDSSLPDHGSSEVEKLLKLVRRIRNNLFHGGKHDVPHNEAKRTETLLRHGLVILNACLDLSPEVRATYGDARI